MAQYPVRPIAAVHASADNLSCRVSAVNVVASEASAMSVAGFPPDEFRIVEKVTPTTGILRRVGRRLYLALGVPALLISLTACGGDTMPELTLDEMGAETARIVDESISRIDPTLIDRIEEVRDAANACNAEDVDPDGSRQQWNTHRNVWLTDEAAQRDIVDELVGQWEAEQWTVGRDGTSTDGTGRRVLLTAPDGASTGFTVRFNGGDNGSTPGVIYIDSVSPCAEVPT